MMRRLEAKAVLWVEALRRWPEWAVAVVVIFGCVLLIFGRLLIRPSLMIWGSDFIQFYYWEDFTRSELAAGRLPQWNPYFFSGYPALANPQMMVFYPVAMALRLLPLSYAFGVGIALHIGWGGLGMYWLSRQQGLSRAAAFVAGIAFMLSGIVIPHITGGHVEWLYTIGWLPWVLFAWQRVLREPRPASALWAAVATALMILGGALRVIVCAGVMVAILMAVEGWHTFHPATKVAATKARSRPAAAENKALPTNWVTATAVSIGLGLLLALGLAAPQLLPSFELASLSSRAAGLPLECANDLSLMARELLYVGFPRLPFDTVLEWERHSYVGAMGIGLALIGLVVRNLSASSAWKPTLIAWGVVGLLLSAGPALPVYPLFRLIPIAGLVRQPFTFVVLVSVAGAGLAGVGADWVMGKLNGNQAAKQSHPAPGVQPLVIAWLGVAIWFVTAAVIDIALYRRAPSPTDQTFYGIVNWLAIFSMPRVLLAGAVLLWRFGGRRWLTTTAIVTLLYVDLWLFAYGRISFLPATSPQVQAGATPRLNIAEARILTAPYTFSNRSMAVQTGNAQGYAPIVVETYRAFNTGPKSQTGCPSFENAEIDGDETHLLESLSVKYVIDADGNVLETHTPWPRAQWVAKAIAVNSSANAIVHARGADYAPAQLIYIEEQDATQTTGTGSVHLTNYQTQSVTLEVESTSDGWVYLNDVWYPGWSATVNGEPQKIYRANGTFRAVPVPAGHSLVEMTFHSTYLNLGSSIGLVTVGTLILLALLLVASSRRGAAVQL